MSPQAVAVTNNFKDGLITEASGLNFPESACTETYNCEFDLTGAVSRRLGLDFETGFTTKNINRTDNALSSYRWRNVSGNGDLTVFVTQIGATIYFYKMNTNALSSGAVSSTISLSSVSGAPTPEVVEAQFSDGGGYLFITHPYCEPMRVSYNTSNDTVSATNITLQIRDFEGAVADPYDVDERPTATLAGEDVNHTYNLYNQGWTTTNLNTWDSSQTTMPSNSDVMWRFKNTSNAFDMSTLANIMLGNTAAPKGHFILDLSNQDRDTAAGTSGVTATTTGFQRPSTSAFFAGRVFYAGINSVGFNSKIYFTQIIERVDQYGFCYQTNDPSAEDLFDLLQSDGGVVSIPEAGTIYKLVSVPGGLAVFAANGVWFITGSTGLGFSATDYTVQKISSVPTITASSFVDVNGFPAWWNEAGIYIMVSSQTGLPLVQSMTYGKIATFYDNIPISSKRHARGFFHNINGKIQWIFRSTDTSDVSELYEFDTVLNFNTFTNAFYPWSISESDVKINAIVVLDSSSGNISLNNVVDNSGNNVVDNSGNQVVLFSTSESVPSLKSKYLVSYQSGTTYSFTFAEEANQEYMDWFKYDAIGTDFTSYFITGYRLRGQAIKKFQSNWVKIFSKTEIPVSYYFQGIWDYANTGSGTGRWSSRQLVTHSNDDYDYASRRLKVRGHGTTLQFKVQSIAGEPFDIIGWSELDTGNTIP